MAAAERLTELEAFARQDTRLRDLAAVADVVGFVRDEHAHIEVAGFFRAAERNVKIGCERRGLRHICVGSEIAVDSSNAVTI